MYRKEYLIGIYAPEEEGETLLGLCESIREFAEFMKLNIRMQFKSCISYSQDKRILSDYLVDYAQLHLLKIKLTEKGYIIKLCLDIFV